MIREVIEADLGTARRTLLHRRIAQVLEQADDPPVEALAYHYARAGERASAARWLEQAGDRAAAGFATNAALEHFSAARDHLLATGAPAVPLSRVAEKLGDLYLLTGALEQSEGEFRPGTGPGKRPGAPRGPAPQRGPQPDAAWRV